MFDQIKANLVEIQPEKRQNVQKTGFLQKAPGFDGLKFEVKNLVDTHQTVAQQPGVPLWGRATVWWCSITLFFPFNLSLNLTKFHLNSYLPPP